jgi:membrane protease YdiL (CAAX protease family)
MNITTSAGQSDLPDSSTAAEAIPVLVYCLAYTGLLFGTLESEGDHWLSLVLLPFGMLLLLARARGKPSVRGTLSSIGIAKGRLRNGLVLATAIGATLAALQLVFSRSRDQIIAMLTSVQALYLLPLTLILLLATAAATEEFFFRGVLMTRLHAKLGAVPALLISSFLFGLYHLPYAYLHPRWPSHGDWDAALVAAFGQGGIGGLILGGVFLMARGNLLAPVVVHALINLPPVAAMVSTMVRRGN